MFVLKRLYFIGVCSFCKYAAESFAHKWMWDFIECFSYICWDCYNDVYLSFYWNELFGLSICILYSFPYIPRLLLIQLWYLRFLMFFLDSICLYYVKNFFLYSSYILVIIFFICKAENEIESFHLLLHSDFGI